MAGGDGDRPGSIADTGRPSPGDPDYKAQYFGDLRTRDAAYHQGTVWGWLVGPFIDAWLKVYPDDIDGARRVLQGLVPHLDQACIGSISEVFDAEAPFRRKPEGVTVSR